MTDSNTDQLVDRLRAGVRQRRAERTTQSDLGSAARLAELYRHQTLSEHTPSSHRKLLGPVMVGAKTLMSKLFLGWYMRPLIQQQSQYNHAATRAILGLAEESEELRRENTALSAELEQLRDRG